MRISSDPRHQSRRGVGAALRILVLLLLPGCGDDGRVPLYPAVGRVLVDGEPAPDVQVVLYPADQVGDPDALRPRGTTGTDGSFVAGTYEKGDGAPAGRYVVTLFRPDVPPGPTPPDDLLGGKYANPEASGLAVTVLEGPTELEPFRVTGAASRAAGRRRTTPALPDVDGMEGSDRGGPK